MVTLNLETFEVDIQGNAPLRNLTSFSIQHSNLRQPSGRYAQFYGNAACYGTAINALVNHFSTVVPLLKQNKGTKNPKPIPKPLLILIARAVVAGLGIRTKTYTFNVPKICHMRGEVNVEVPVKNGVSAKLGSSVVHIARFKKFEDVDMFREELIEMKEEVESALEQFNIIMDQIKQAYEDIQK